MSNTTFPACCREVAEKNCKDLPYTVYESPSTLMQQAAELYADRRVEEAKGTANVVNEYEEGFGTYGVTECCRFGPIVDENYCPECGKKINKPTQP